MRPEVTSAAAPSPPPEADSTPKNIPCPTNTFASNGFFRLPIEIRRIIYELVLAVKHPLYLFRDGHGWQGFAPEIPHRWLALLYTNRRIHEEAADVAYGSNRFTLVDMTEQNLLLQCFLDDIGPANASSVSYLAINFPDVDMETHRAGESRVVGEAMQVLELLQKRCNGLTTLEMMMHGETARKITQVDEDDLGLVQDTFSQIDVLLQGIPSLNRVVVRLHGGEVRPSVMEAMQRLKWVVFIGDRKEPVKLECGIA